ncbi:DEAD/DEAH box helicase, partial [Chloroflexota bacterium]
MRSYRVPQRGHEINDTRHPAVRALILYPMNALVEDQLTRLRRALDSPQARLFCSEHMNGNRIYFGRYTGNTPEPGHEYNEHGNPDRKRIERLASKLSDLDRGARAIANYAAQKESQATTEKEREAARDTIYFFPRLDGAEMRCRWDIQQTPPDILITNYSMLSIMLMREADSPLFEKTRDWLNQPGNVFHLIVDELHLYRGTSGTEVAYLIRLLLHRLGLTPTDPRLRILASSASLNPTDANSLSFLSDFFGCEWIPEQIIPGSEQPIPDIDIPPLDAKPFAAVAQSYQTGDIDSITESFDQLATSLNPDTTADEPYTRLCTSLESNQEDIAARILMACLDGERTRAISLTNFATSLFTTEDDQQVALDAVRGLFIVREFVALRESCNLLPSFRLHWFFRNIEGLWACVMPGCQCDTNYLDGIRPIGKLFSQNRILCGGPDPQHRVLELLYCEQCGTIFFGGSRLPIPDGGGIEIVSMDPDIEGLPDKQAARFVDKRTYGDFAIFWPIGNSELKTEARQWSQPYAYGNGSERARWVPRYLNAVSGHVMDTPTGAQPPEGIFIPGHLYIIPGIDGTDAEHDFSALPACCPNCASDYSRRLYRNSPVRGFRTGFSRVSQLLSKELFYTLPEGEIRKLVVFSDSREDAASVSNGIERMHYSDLVRETMYDELHRIALGEGLLISDLEEHGEPRCAEAVDYAARNPEIVNNFLQDIKRTRIPIPDDLDEILRESLEKEQQRAISLLLSVKRQAETHIVPLNALYESRPNDSHGTHSILLIKRL